jgi:predicted transcriptional regulator
MICYLNIWNVLRKLCDTPIPVWTNVGKPIYIIQRLDQVVLSGSTGSYRDRIYIVEDIILKLTEYGELNQTSLISFCGLNLKSIKRFLMKWSPTTSIRKKKELIGKKSVSVYIPTSEGIRFFNTIPVPYEKMFPRIRKQAEIKTKLIMICFWIIPR